MTERLERPTLPTRHRLDVDAYYKMAETGILKRAKRVELIDGEIIDMPAIGSAHAGKVNRLASLFIRAVDDRLALINVQSPLRLDAFNEPEPDLVVLRPRADAYEASHPGATDVLLLVEVADSSLAYDRGVKLALYAKFGIPEVWIVDTANATIEVCRDPEKGAYTSREERNRGALSPRLVPRIGLNVETLFA